MYVRLCVALLALSSFAAAADPECEELTKTLDDLNKAAGKYIYITGTSDNEEFRAELKRINSSWIEIILHPDNDTYTLRFGDKMDGKCYVGSVNCSYFGNYTKTVFNFNSTTNDHTGKHLETCADCVLWTDHAVKTLPNGDTKTGNNIYLFSKTGKVEDSDLETFKKQAACLGFPSDFKFGSNSVSDLCPDEEAAAEEAQ